MSIAVVGLVGVASAGPAVAHLARAGAVILNTTRPAAAAAALDEISALARAAGVEVVVCLQGDCAVRLAPRASSIWRFGGCSGGGPRLGSAAEERLLPGEADGDACAGHIDALLVSSFPSSHSATLLGRGPLPAEGTPAAELVAYVDAADEPLGVVCRALMRRLNLRHRASYVFLANSAGALYVQRRTRTKDYCPGYLDPATGGVMGVGEDPLESARRELAEEMGVTGLPLRFLFKFFHGHAIVGYAYDCPPYDGPLRLQPEEVAGVEVLSPAQVRAIAAAAAGGTVEERVTPDGLEALVLYERQLEVQRFAAEEAERS